MGDLKRVYFILVVIIIILINIKITQAVCNTTNKTIDIIFSLDSSGSMLSTDPAGDRKTASKNFVDRLNPTNDRAGVVSWDDNIDFTQTLTNDFVLVKQKIDLVDDFGGTNLDVGLDTSIDDLQINGRTNSSKIIIFLTDGVGTYTHTGFPGSQADRALGLGIRVYTIGLAISPGSTAEADLIEIATVTGGTYYSSPSSSNLDAIFNNISQSVFCNSPQVYFGIGTKPNNTKTPDDFIFVNVTVISDNPSNITYSLYNTTGLVNRTTLGLGDLSFNLSINFTNLFPGYYFYNVSVTDTLNNRNQTPTRGINLTGIPVLLVHGYCSSYDNTWGVNNNKKTKWDIIDFGNILSNSGFRVYSIDFPKPTNKRIITYVPLLMDKIDQIKRETGATKVNIVAHSMGGLITRWYIQNGGYYNYRKDISQLIMIATPNHGSGYSDYEWINPDWTPFCKGGSGGFWTDNAASNMHPLSPFMSQLNYGERTFNIDSWYSNPEIIGTVFGVKYSTLGGTSLSTEQYVKVSLPPFATTEATPVGKHTDNLGDSVVPLNSLKLINVGCNQYPGKDHTAVHEDINILNRVVELLKNRALQQGDDCMTSHNSPTINFNPLTSTTISQGQNILIDNFIDYDAINLTFVIAWENETNQINFNLIDPNNNVIDYTSLVANYTEFPNLKRYIIEYPLAGDWKINISGVNISGSYDNLYVRSYFTTNILFSIQEQFNNYSQNPGGSLKLVAFLFNDTNFTNPILNADIKAEIFSPDNSSENITLYDDGLHNDFNASDGVYGNTYLNTNIEGIYEVSAVANATVGAPSNPDGITNGLLAYWKLDEGSGTTTNDFTSNLNNGNIFGASWFAGKYNNALSFDGVDDYVQVPASSSLNITTGDFTLMAWVNIDPTFYRPTESGVIVAKTQLSYNPGYAFAISGTDRKLNFEISQNPGGVPNTFGGVSSFIVPDNSWHHVAITFSRSANATFYLDGMKYNDVDISLYAGDLSNTRELFMGKSETYPNLFKGKIDDIKIFNRALSSQEVSDEYNKLSQSPKQILRYATQLFWVETYPDLMLNQSSLNIIPTIFPKENQKVNISVTVFNIGDSKATNVTVFLFDEVNGSTVDINSSGILIPEINAGSLANIVFEWNGTTPTGNHTIVASAATFDSLEKDYSNNDANKTIFVSSSSGIPVSSCQVINQSGNYLLSSNITLTTQYGTRCIDIQANDVVFDCRGNSIRGSGAAWAGTTAFYVTGNNSVVKNCILSDMGRGVETGGSNNLVLGNIIYNMWEGLNAGANSYTKYNTFENNTVFNNTVAEGRAFVIWWGPSGNIVRGNKFTNSNYGIDLGYCGGGNPFPCITNNTFYNNYIAGNVVNARDFSGYNFWNITKTPGTNIIGGPFIGGNFWSDYTGVDINGDRLGDTNLPYNSSSNIANGGDYLPLVNFSAVPLSSCQTISSPGDYILTNNLTTSSGSCIIINSNFVNLNCNNFWIISNSSGNGIEVWTSNSIIKNCNIIGFNLSPGNGIIIILGSNNSILNNRLINNIAGVKLYPNSGVINNLVMNNFATGNSYAGFLLQTPGNNFINNTAISNTGSGFTMQSSLTTNNNFTGNTVINNSGGGFNLQPGPRFNTFANNIIKNNGNAGFAIDLGSINNTINSNIISENPKGVLFTDSSARDNLIYNNLLNNSINVEGTNINFWNISKTPGVNIVGGPYIGGNFWSDYTGVDTNGDGLGDTLVPFNGDYLPLIATSILDTTPPTVSITSPTSGSTVQGIITIQATATDNVAVAGVQFKVDGSNIGAEDTTSPYQASLNTSTLTNGNHILTATARDTSNNNATSTPVTINVNNIIIDTTPPTQPTGLSATAVSSSQINIVWTASTDNVAVAGYRIYRYSVPIATTTSTSYSDTGLTPSTTYIYQVQAYDTSNNNSTLSASSFDTTFFPTSGGGGAGSGGSPFVKKKATEVGPID